jgi:hypothetical protein
MGQMRIRHNPSLLLQADEPPGGPPRIAWAPGRTHAPSQSAQGQGAEPPIPGRRPHVGTHALLLRALYARSGIAKLRRARPERGHMDDHGPIALDAGPSTSVH